MIEIAGTTAIVSALSAVLPPASVTRNEKLAVPAVVGVPVNWPVDGCSVTPAGSAPLATDHV